MTPSTRQRKHPRIAVDLTAKLFVGDDDTEAVPAALKNVARGGVFVETDAPAAVGTRVNLCFRMLATRMCLASGRVVWSGADRGGFGMQFDKTNHEMDCFVRSLNNLPRKLRQVYLSDVLEPHIRLVESEN